MNRRKLLRTLAAVTTAGVAASTIGRSQTARAQDAPESGPGPRNLITDVPGLKIGQADNALYYCKSTTRNVLHSYHDLVDRGLIPAVKVPHSPCIEI